MNFYVIIDKKTGEIIGTHTKYLLGTEEPVECSSEEIYKMYKEDYSDRTFDVLKAPAKFDVRQRGKKLVFDKKTKKLKISSLRKPLKSK